MEPMQFALVVSWLVAAGLALRFGMGNARAWSSMAIGFLLIPASELLPVMLAWLPGPHTNYAPALGHLAGIAAILVVHHSVQDYYTFTQTLEERETRPLISLPMAGALGAAGVLLLASPEPTLLVNRAMHVVENTSWLLLALINVGLIRRIRRNLGDTPISKGFFALAAVFGCIALWKGGELYLDVYQLDLLRERFPLGYLAASFCSVAGDALASIGASATFISLARLLR